MARIEKTVFISYRRADESWGLAIFQDLTQHGYDVFIDYDGIASGNFETVILENIRARAHFLVLLTPTAMDRCDDPRDWMRREIEAALDSRRNIVPLMLEGFDFGTPTVTAPLTGKLAELKNYNGLEIPKARFFSSEMERLRNKFLSVKVDAVLHPPSDSAQRAATEQKDKVAIALGDEQRKPTEAQWHAGARSQKAIKSVGDKSKELQPAQTPWEEDLDLTTARAALDKARKLHSLKLNDQAIAVYDDLIASFGGAAELPLGECVASALGDKLACLLNLGRYDQADKVFNDLLVQFGTATELPLRMEVARALDNKGSSIAGQNRHQVAITVFDQILVQFGTATELPLRENVASALIKKGLSLEALAKKEMTRAGRDYREAAIKSYDDLIGRFGAATELSLRKYVARALINKAADIVALDHRDLAFSVYDDLIDRFGGAIELSLREYVAQALFGKHGLYLVAHDWQNAVAVCDDLIVRFSGSTELSLREYVARARFEKAEGFDRLGRNDEAVAVLRDFQGQFGTTSELWLLKMVKEANDKEKKYLERETAKRESKPKIGTAANAVLELEAKRRSIQEKRGLWIAIGGPPVVALTIGLSVSMPSMIGADAGRRTFIAAFYALLAIFTGLMLLCAELPGRGGWEKSFKWVAVAALTIGLSALTVSMIGPDYMRGTGTLTFVAVSSMVLGMYSGLMALYAERDADWKWKRIILVCVVVAALTIVVGLIVPQPTTASKDSLPDIANASSLWLSLMFAATLSLVTAIYSILMSGADDYVLSDSDKQSNWIRYAIGWLAAGIVTLFLAGLVAKTGIVLLTTVVSVTLLISLALAILSGLRLMFLYLELF